MKTIVFTSGGFDPIHTGHIRYFRDAKKLGDKLIVIINNDNWLMKKKGYVFMKQKERYEIISNIKYVDYVIFTRHKKDTNDMSVCSEIISYIKKNKKAKYIFANGGDRFQSNIPEYILFKKLGIDMVDNVGGKKIQSSSWLINRVKNK